jgi:hypothetical protein
MLEPPDLAIIIAVVPAQTAVSDALFKPRDEQSRIQALASASLRGRLSQNASQNSAGSVLPCLTMISWGEIGAEASSTLPANFGLATVAIDQTTAVTAMATIAVKMMSLRISCHLSIVMGCATALPHRSQRQREALTQANFFGRGGCRGSPAGVLKAKPNTVAWIARNRGPRLQSTALVASPAGLEPATCGYIIRPNTPGW